MASIRYSDQSMETIPLDLLKRAYRLIYDSSLQQLIAEELLDRWGRVNLICSALLALFAAGSMVTGWSFWKTQTGGVLWGILSGTVSVLAIINTALQIPDRVKAQSDLSVKFRDIELRAENLYNKLPSISEGEAERRITAIDTVYRNLLLNAPKDILLTERWKDKIQLRINETMRRRGYLDDQSAARTQ
ncbi:MAG: hypothetical protein M3Y24_11375 [Acidobacteriota bacterium]|nr:hypothetical protein [Acidobacteriota bacterium]